MSWKYITETMDHAYTYGRKDRIYLNATNRCTNCCEFCVRRFTDRLGSGMLKGDKEAERDGLLAAWKGLADGQEVQEVIWCGFGEPTFKLDLVLELSPLLRKQGMTIRLNTNGHGCLIHGRDILPDLGKVVDQVNVSLNAPDEATYLGLCNPDPGTLNDHLPTPSPGDFWRATMDFLHRATDFIDEVQASVVTQALTSKQLAAAEKLAMELGADKFRAR